MVSTSAEAFAPAAPAERRVSRFAEFLAVGGVTVFLFPLAWLLRSAVGADASELGIGFLTFYGAYVINDPHFSVTYLLFYRNVRDRALGRGFGGRQRARYVFAGFVVPAILVGWAGYALSARSAPALGVLVQLMFLLVGWHYVKQGFGVLSVLAARRGHRIAPEERRALLFHCYAAWAFAWANPSAPAGEFEEKGVVYGAIAHPRWLELGTGALLAGSVVALVAVLVTSFRRGRRLPPTAPFAVFLVTVWSWSIFSSIDPFVQYLIPALHSVQYLYFVWLVKRGELREAAGPFADAPTSRWVAFAASALLLGFALFHGVPGLLDAAFVPKRGVHGDLGPTPFFAAFFVIVNIHHYFMDTVIWRRETPEARYLTA